MFALVGPVRAQANGYSYAVWTVEGGLRAGASYPFPEDADRARQELLRERNSHAGGPMIACDSIDDFVSKIAVLTSVAYELSAERAVAA